MRKKNKILTIVILILISLSSCNDWLFIEPEDGIIRQNYWQSKEDVRLAVFGVYASMIEPDLVAKFFLWGELRADMLQQTSTTPLDYANILNGTILPDNAVCKWDLFYKTINLCNVVLTYAPAVMDIDPTFTQEELNGYQAEMLGVRSLLYFYLVRTFGEVPLVLTATLDDSKDYSIAKSDQQTILNQIITDLETAKTNAVTTYETVSNDKGRFTKYSIEALLADVYLWNEQYDNCINNCQDIINSKNYGIIDTANASNWFADVFILGNSFSESIFELQTNTGVLVKKAVNSPFYTMFSQKQLQINAKIANFFPESPEALVPDIRGKYASYNFDNYKIWKYIAVSGGSEMATGTSKYTHWFFYRYADVMLMCAEALAQRNQGNDTVTVREYIDEIRLKRFADPLTVMTPTNKKEWTLYILEERAREFAYEGKRWFDVLRNAKRNNYENLDILLNMITSGAPAAVQQSLRAKAQDKLSHYLPIYANELVTNKLLKQNEFYNK